MKDRPNKFKVLTKLGDTIPLRQSQKTQGFCVADFATVSDERKSRSKLFPLFIWIKEPCVRKFEGLEPSKRLGISQTIPVQLVGACKESDLSDEDIPDGYAWLPLDRNGIVKSCNPSKF